MLVNNQSISKVDHFSFLGIIVDDKLNWKHHLNAISIKLSRSNAVFSRLKNFLPRHILKLLYFSLFASYLNYGILCWGFSCGHIFKLQKKCVRLITKSKYNSHTDPLFRDLRIIKLSDMLNLKMIMFYYDYERRALPNYFIDSFLIRQNRIHDHNTRNAEDFRVPRTNINLEKLKLRYALPSYLNEVNPHLISIVLTSSKYLVKNQFKRICFENYDNVCSDRNCYVCSN